MEVKKNELEDFLDENLLRFIMDDAPLPSTSEFFSDSHTHKQNFDDNFVDADGCYWKRLSNSKKPANKLLKVILAVQH